jgi:hypothetical protein
MYAGTPVRDASRMNTHTEKLPLAVDTREAARLLSVFPRSIQNYIRAKLLPARKIGRRTVIPMRALEAFLRSDQPSPVSKASGDGDAL